MSADWNEFIRAVANHTFMYPWMAECIIAQSILECGRGTTELFKNHFNPSGMKYRNSLAKYGGKKYKYFTDSEPYRDEAGNEVPEGTPGAKQWDYFFEFAFYEDAIKTWENWWFRTEGDWTPYPMVAEKDPSVLKDSSSFLRYIGPIYCPYFENSHDESYHDYIMNKCMPEARKTLAALKPQPKPNPNLGVTWYEFYRLVDKDKVTTGLVGWAGDKPKFAMDGIHSGDFNKIMLEHGTHNILVAPATKPWPGRTTPPEPVSNLAEKLMNLANSEGKKALELTDDPKCEAEKYVKAYRRELGMPSGRFAWCACFICWCLEQVGIGIDFTPDEDKLTLAYCPTWEKWARRMKVFNAPEGFTPRAGDIILFGVPGKEAHHIGFVCEYKDGKLFCTEGNNENKTIYHVDRTTYNIRGYVRIFDEKGSLIAVPGLYEKKEPKPTGKRIYLDPGHSKSSPGARGTSPNVKEEEMNLLACKVMKAEFEAAGHSVTFIDPDPDDLEEVGRAAKGYDAAFCLHHNAYSKKDHYTRCYLASNPKLTSINCSKVITAAISKAIGIPDNGFEKSGFTVPNLFEEVCSGPSCLIEFYFIDAYGDVNVTKERTTKAATAAAKAIIDYLG